MGDPLQQEMNKILPLHPAKKLEMNNFRNKGSPCRFLHLVTITENTGIT
jgi:hypothetical protein